PGDSLSPVSPKSSQPKSKTRNPLLRLQPRPCLLPPLAISAGHSAASDLPALARRRPAVGSLQTRWRRTLADAAAAVEPLHSCRPGGGGSSVRRSLYTSYQVSYFRSG
ncbi:hypothetical protein Taro_003112, partial [Colocasia esculenta]|nr:hypothetical protein [Colocasia esculenta]